MAGVKGRSGRKRDPRNITRYFNEMYDKNAYALAEITVMKALDGDREMIIYCHDRRLGKPKATTDINLEGGSDIGKGVIAAMMEAWEEARRGLGQGVPTIQLLEGGNDAIQRQGEAEGVLEGQEASAEGVHPR